VHPEAPGFGGAGIGITGTDLRAVRTDGPGGGEIKEARQPLTEMPAELVELLKREDKGNDSDSPVMWAGLKVDPRRVGYIKAPTRLRKRHALGKTRTI
jgi:hypothetical protein